jgi:basic membrane protein A
MRRIAALVALGALSVALLGGGASGGSRQLKVALVTDIISTSSRDLRGVIYLGFLRGVKQFGVQGRAVQTDPKQGIGPALAELGRQGYDLVFTGIPGSDQDLKAIASVAARFPRSRFAIPIPIQDLPARPKNVVGSFWHPEEPSYLAGYLAGLMEKARPGKDVVGSVGGYPVGDVFPFIAGFEAGAKKADPGITTLRGYANDFVNPAKCKAVARSQIAEGAGVVFPVAGLCGLGALQAAKAEHVWGIGVDVDESFLGPHILTSVLKGAKGQDVFLTIKALVQGKLRTGGNLQWNLANGGVGLGTISPKVPRAFVQRLDAIRRQIAAGKIRVPSTLG